MNNDSEIENIVDQNKNKSETKIIYDINKKDKEYEEDEQNINTFGVEFIENNKIKL